MADIVVLFESKYGQSEKIAHHLAARARRAGHQALALRITRDTPFELQKADGVVVVAPVYFGKHPAHVRAFLRAHREVLGERPLAFVSVSGSAANAEPAARAGAERLARAFVAEVGLAPQLVLTAGGAVAYPRYGLLLRLVARIAFARRGAPIDTTRVQEYTDWRSLERDMCPFFESLDGSTAGAKPGIMAGP